MRRIHGGIHEDDGARLGNGVGQLGREQRANQGAHAGIVPGRHGLGHARAGAIVAPQRVAVADDEKIIAPDGGWRAQFMEAQTPALRATTQPRMASFKTAPSGADQLNVQGHLSDGMSRATQARIVTADAMFHPVEQRFGNDIPAHVMARDLRHGLVHGQVVLAGGNDQVDLFQQAVAIHGVIVEQRAARRLARAHAAQAVDAGVGPKVFAQQIRVVQGRAR